MGFACRSKWADNWLPSAIRAASIEGTAMQQSRLALALSIALLTSGTAFGQATVGELLAAGGKQLSKEEVVATISGATLSGPLAAGGETQIEWSANGSVSGYVINATGRRGAIFGTWKVDDNGQVCRDMSVKFYETTQVKDCFPMFRLGDQVYFPVSMPANPSVAVVKRTIKK
jgi:hypothetical protein